MASRLPAIGKKDISSLRSTLEYLREIGELVATDVEVDPHLEVAAIQKHFDGGAPLLFEKVNGYPDARIANNFYATAERIARLFDVQRRSWTTPGRPSSTSTSVNTPYR